MSTTSDSEGLVDRHGAPADPDPPHNDPQPGFEGLHEEAGKKQKKRDRKEREKEQLGTSRGIETLFRTSYRTHMDLSALADAKANIMITINGLMASILLASITPRIDANPWLLLPTTVLLGACLGALVFAVLAARPHLTQRTVTLDDVRRDAANVLFFGNFTSLPQEDYVTGMTELIRDGDRLYVSMLRDIYHLGQVLERKFRLLRISYIIFMWGLVTGVVLFVAVFLGDVLLGVQAPAGTRGL